MEILAKPSTVVGAPHMFTGGVWLDVLRAGAEPSRMRATTVRFAPGARTVWHRHASSQTLHVTEGVALMQARGGPVLVVHPGQTVDIPAGEWHWHGATPDSFMTHLALWEGAGPGGVPESDWGDPVSDAEYAAR
jgi:quercetin dioxygenase-like cupin family protein